MIAWINGNLGGGKTALGVAFTYSTFPNKVYDSQNWLVKRFFPSIEGVKRDKKKIYTNVSGFAFDDFEGHAEFLNWDIIDKCALAHFNIHESNRGHLHIDKALNSFFDQVANGVEFDDLESDLDLRRVKRYYDAIKGFQFNHVVFLIDEAADFLVEGQPHLDKWFNYSRHLFQDMILIQNDLSNVDKAYKNQNVVTAFIRAAEAKYRWHPRLFKYAFYTKWTQPDNEKPPLKMFWFPLWVFKKYDSAQVEAAIPKIYFYLVPFLLLLFYTYHSLGNILNSGASHPETNTSLVPRQIEPAPPPPVVKKIACFTCRADHCIYHGDVFTFQRIKAYTSLYDFSFLYNESHSGFSKFCYSAKDSFFELYPSVEKESDSLISFGAPAPDKK